MVDPERLEQPLLFVKTGAIGGFPSKFLPDFAHSFGAKLLTSEGIKAQLSVGAPGRRISSSKVSRRFVAKAKLELSDGHDVVEDRFFNVPKSRSINVRDVARQTGALSVVLYYKPPIEVIRDRADQWWDEGSLGAHGFEHPIQAVSRAKAMLDELVEPNTNEGLDHVIRLDGSQSTLTLLGDIDDYLHDHGIERDIMSALGPSGFDVPTLDPFNPVFSHSDPPTAPNF